MASTSCATSTAGSRPSCACGTRSTRSTSRRSRTSGSTTGRPRGVPWRRGKGYDVAELENVFTADHAWARLVVEEIRRKIADPRAMRASATASVWVTLVSWPSSSGASVYLPWLSGARRPDERRAALRDLADGQSTHRLHGRPLQRRRRHPERRHASLLRPTDSPTLFLQQLGRGLRTRAREGECTVLDFVGNHRKEFRFDRRLRALLGGSRATSSARSKRLSVPPGRLPLPPRCGG